MCGICGIVSKEKGNGLELIGEMNNSLVHRGPDDGSVWTDDNLALGHRRLSIIDLTKNGLQPMTSADGGYVIVFNGEIYNFQDLREELIGKGYIFRSKTDTEVIMAAYDHLGDDCVNRFEGMWAFAIYDKKKQRVFFSRDRFGKKPLYYIKTDKYFAFASQPKALLKLLSGNKMIDEEALSYYLTYGYIPGEYSIWKSIKKMGAATAMTFDLNTWETKSKHFWDTASVLGKSLIENNLEEKTRSLLLRSVRKRLVSDVPVGAYLSGGVDSSGIVAAVSKEIGSLSNFHTFSIGFDYERYDETGKAKQVAEWIGSRHHSKVLGSKEAFDILNKLPEYYDEPFADSSMIPSYALAEMARSQVTVCLSGDGADELWGGYLNYIMYSYVHSIKQFSPSFLHNLIGKGAEALSQMVTPARTNPGLALGLRSLQWVGDTNSSIFARISSLHADTHEKYYSLFDKYFNQKKWQDNLMQSYLNTHLVDDFLVKVDRASMANGLEVRCPYLDREFAEFALGSVSAEKKVAVNGVRYKLKTLLRRALRPWLPPQIITQGKQGFSLPMSEYLVNEWRSPVGEAVMELASSNFLPISRKQIEITVRLHNKGVADYSQFIYALYFLSLWRQKWL